MNILLYSAVCLVWGSTWIAMKMQVGSVPVSWSVVFRFGFATLIFFLICLIKKYPLRFSKKQHLLLISLGLILFSINYLLFYLGTQYLISGLVAIACASLTVMNVLNSRIFLKTRLNYRVVLGSCIGIVGIILIFGSNLLVDVSQRNNYQTFLGFLFCIVGSYCSSLGNVLAAYNHKRHTIPIMPMNAFGMLYGTLFTLLIVLITQQHFMFDTSPTYLGSLMYLSLFGTVFAFQAYLYLIGKMGPEKVGYVFVITPLLAILISSLYEDFYWNSESIFGVVLVVVGNCLVLINKNNSKKEIPRIVTEELIEEAG